MIIIEDKDRCSGCTACANICPTECIQMLEDEEGFKYPVVNQLKCTNCHLCENVCPILNNSKLKGNTRVFAVQNKNDDIRKKSSAGGFFATVAEYVLLHDGIVFGAGFDEELTVVHKYVETKEQWNNSGLCGSKYVQSELGNSFKKVREFLDAGKMVCFSGVPCQVAGLRSYLGKEYENLILIDLVCHGVPSLKLFRKYLNHCSTKYGSRVTAVNFRDKSYGYSSPNMKLYLANGKTKDQTSDVKSFLRAFFRGISSRPSCYNCSFKTVTRVSDFTLGDCQNIGMFNENMDDDKGTTIVYIHSLKGLNIFNNIRDCVFNTELNLDIFVRTSGKFLIKSDTPHPKRKDFFANIDNFSYKILINKFVPERFANKCANIIKPILYKTGLVKHGVLKKILKKRKKC